MSTPYPDLPAAMIAWLRASPGVAAAFAEDAAAPATTKFWADAARPGVTLPWAVYEELGADLQPMTAARGAVCTIETGVVRFTIAAAGKKAARDLGRLIATTLDDAPLLFTDGRLMYFRAGSTRFQHAHAAPACPAPYARIVDFEFMVQRSA